MKPPEPNRRAGTLVPAAGGVARNGGHKRARPTARCDRNVLYAITLVKFAEILSRNAVVESHFCSGPTRSARSLVMKPDSTVSMQTFSSVPENVASSELLSSLARCARPRDQAKTEAIELVEVS